MKSGERSAESVGTHSAPALRTRFARVAELVDAADSKSAVRKNVLVRFQSRAQNQSEV